MSYDSGFTQIGDIVEFDQSVNPISTPSISSNTSMVDDEQSNNGDNDLYRLHHLRGHLGHKERNDNVDYVLSESGLL